MSRRALVTGGGGYVGSRLCQKLMESGYVQVTALDVHFIEENVSESVSKIKGDIRNYEELREVVAVVQPDIVFHIASFGMSGHQMFDKEMIESVNIQGTKNILEACLQSGVQHLVYTSTYNVVFGGQVIRNGDESLPYFPLDKHVDHYSRTKSIAEQAVLSANESPLHDDNKGRRLKVCALRCAGIYGEGEQRHLPRIVSYLRRGLVLFSFGSEDVKTDFLHVDNFVQAHIKAADALISPQSTTSGKAYFISDNNPINNFVFFGQLFTGLGYSCPKIRLPLWIVFYLAYFVEIIHRLVGKIYNFQPFLTRAEVYKVGVTHYFSIDRATRDFGYQPERKTLDGVIKWFRDRGYSKGKRQTSNTVCNHFILIALVLVTVALIISYLPLAN